MRTFIGAASFMLAVSPWILPLIAAAAKLAHEDARSVWRGEGGQDRSGDHGSARSDDEARGEPPPGCIEAKLPGERRPQ